MAVTLHLSTDNAEDNSSIEFYFEFGLDSENRSNAFEIEIEQTTARTSRTIAITVIFFVSDILPHSTAFN